MSCCLLLCMHVCIYKMSKCHKFLLLFLSVLYFKISVCRQTRENDNIWKLNFVKANWSYGITSLYCVTLCLLNYIDRSWWKVPGKLFGCCSITILVSLNSSWMQTWLNLSDLIIQLRYSFVKLLTFWVWSHLQVQVDFWWHW